MSPVTTSSMAFTSENSEEPNNTQSIPELQGSQTSFFDTTSKMIMNEPKVEISQRPSFETQVKTEFNSDSKQIPDFTDYQTINSFLQNFKQKNSNFNTSFSNQTSTPDVNNHLLMPKRESSNDHKPQYSVQKRRRVINVEQRKAANVRERRRMDHLNKAFDSLRNRVPTFEYEKKLSRIDTLRLATDYIAFLASLLHSTPLPNTQTYHSTHLSSEPNIQAFQPFQNINESTNILSKNSEFNYVYQTAPQVALNTQLLSLSENPNNPHENFSRLQSSKSDELLENVGSSNFLTLNLPLILSSFRSQTEDPAQYTSSNPSIDTDVFNNNLAYNENILTNYNDNKHDFKSYTHLLNKNYENSSLNEYFSKEIIDQDPNSMLSNLNNNIHEKENKINAPSLSHISKTSTPPLINDSGIFLDVDGEASISNDQNTDITREVNDENGHSNNQTNIYRNFLNIEIDPQSECYKNNAKSIKVEKADNELTYIIIDRGAAEERLKNYK